LRYELLPQSATAPRHLKMRPVVFAGPGWNNASRKTAVIGYGVDCYLNEKGKPVEAWTDVDETIFLVAAKTDEFLRLFKIHKSGHIAERGPYVIADH
jgi:hypothetical protein